MFRRLLAIWLLCAAVAWAAEDATLSPVISTTLRPVPVKAPTELPKKASKDQSLQVNGIDSELTVTMPGETASAPSVFDDLAPQNNLSSQRAQVVLKRNLLDDVTLTYKNNIGLADTAPTKNGSMTAQSAQSQSSSEVKWNLRENWTVTTTMQTDQIFEFQRAEPNHIGNDIQTHYQALPGTGVGFGVSSNNYYSENVLDLESKTTAGQFSQKLGSLPLTWNANPAMIREYDPQDYTQNRGGSRLDQSLLWNLNQNVSWTVGTGWTDWNYDIDTKRQTDRTLYSQWTRQVRSNYKLIFRTDVETVATEDQINGNTREDRFKLSLGQQLTLSEDLSAAFDLRQEYQREINSSWSPSDHSATLSIQKKF